jgi:hypothetical protein
MYKYLPYIAAGSVLICLIYMYRNQSHLYSRTTDLVNEHNNLVKTVKSQQERISELNVVDVPFDFVPPPPPTGGDVVQDVVEDVEMVPVPDERAEPEPVTSVKKTPAKRGAAKKKDSKEL